jgi:predicted lipoprotein with Yx(FWY)xxD motif
MWHPRIIVVGIALAAVAATGGVTAASAGSSPARSTPAASSSVMAATVHTARATVSGKTTTILVNAQGLPLYIYRPDTATQSLVTGGLVRLWPPLTSAAPTATGLSGKLTVMNNVHGHQVGYNGHPLYTFTSDHAGQVTGQGFQNFFVATPALAPIAPAAGGSHPAAPSGVGLRY